MDIVDSFQLQRQKLGIFYNREIILYFVIKVI